jgi:hypothetical protein
MSVRTASILCAVTSSLAAQTTWVVSGGGAALQQAINSAAPGDTLDVQAGTYSPITATRGLHIKLRSGAHVGQWPSTSTTIVLTSLPATESFVIEGGSLGGEIGGFSATGCAGMVVCSGVAIYDYSNCRVDSCTGPVAYDHCVNLGPAIHAEFSGSFVILNSSQVSVTACDMPQTTVTGSHVTFSQIYLWPYGAMAPVSLAISASSVSINGGLVTGGTAAFSFDISAIRLDSGDLVVTGGATIQESPGGLHTVPAIDTHGGTVRLDPSVTVTGSPPIGGPAPVTIGLVPSLDVARTPGSATFQGTVHSQPGSVAFTLINVPIPVIPSIYGDLWIDPTSPLIDVSVLPAIGTSTFSRALAFVPPFYVLSTQTAVLTTANAIVVSTPRRFVWN